MLNPALTPEAMILQMAFAKWVSRPMGVAVQLELPELLSSRPMSVDEIAKATETHADSLYRMLRALASVGIFEETEARTFRNTPMSDELRRDRVGSVVRMMESDWHNRAWDQLIHCVKTGESGSGPAFGEPVFQWFAQNQQAEKVFDDCMTALSNRRLAHVAAAYDYSQAKLVIDVGGGHGALLTAILTANPALHGMVADRPSVIPGATQRFEAAGIADRCRAVGVDFFDSVPSGGDIYFLSHIIHDWDDERSIQILKNCREAMNPGGRVLLYESVVPEGNWIAPVKLLDLEMMVITEGGRERTELEYEKLLEAAGLGGMHVRPVRGGGHLIEAH